MNGTKHFQNVDMFVRFCKIRLVESVLEKTAFHWKVELSQFEVMQFGLTNGAYTFRRTVEGILNEVDFARSYVHDKAICFKKIEGPMNRYVALYDHIKKSGLRVKLKWSVLGVSHIEVPRVMVSGHSVEPDLAKM